MKKNGAFVNLFLSEGLQKSPKRRRQPKASGAELLYFSELQETAQEKPEHCHANLIVIYICRHERHQNSLIGSRSYFTFDLRLWSTIIKPHYGDPSDERR